MLTELSVRRKLACIIDPFSVSRPAFSPIRLSLLKALKKSPKVTAEPSGTIALAILSKFVQHFLLLSMLYALHLLRLAS